MQVSEAYQRARQAAVARTQNLSSRTKWWLGVSSAALLVFAVALYFSIRPAVDWAVTLMYQNVVAPDDGETAVTVTAYPSSPNVVSIIGGRGEGLNCSIPFYVKAMFPNRADKLGRRAPVTQRFRQACVFHDLCYRHGLATYGYTQADCDEMLQVQAMRICMRSFPESTCQLDAKKVLAGVTHGGFNSYKSWDSSTYFEFDSNPVNSDRMSVARVIDHPFKAVDLNGTRNDPEQLILSFEIVRSGITVACRNCSGREFTDEELFAAGLVKPSGPVTPSTSVSIGPPAPPQIRPGVVAADIALARKSLGRAKMDQPRPVGMPSDGIYSAPQLVVTAEGSQSLMWFNRDRIENTVTCTVLADPKNLLTHTRPDDSDCRPGQGRRMTLIKADYNSSSPQPLTFARPAGGPNKGSVITGSGLWIDRPDKLHDCVSTDLPLKAPHGWLPRCHAMHDLQSKQIKADVGVLQNFPIIKGARQIYLWRTVYSGPDDHDDSRHGRALVLDADNSQLATGAQDRSGVVKLTYDLPFTIPDDYDPMVALTRDPDDLRLASLLSKDGRISIHEIDLKANAPQPVRMTMSINGADADLDASWARRPALLIAPAAGARETPKTQFLFSRSIVTTTSENAEKEDSARFEFLVLERDRYPQQPSPLKYVRGLQCRIKYALPASSNPHCRQSSVLAGDKRPSPARMLQGAQLVTGKLSAIKDKADDIALIDACIPGNPIVLHPVAAEEVKPGQTPALAPVLAAIVGRKGASNKSTVLRQVDCGPLSVAQITQPMVAGN